jgi:hypothetical protein
VSETYDESLLIVTALAQFWAYAEDEAAAQTDSAIKAESFFMMNSLRYKEDTSGLQVY